MTVFKFDISECFINTCVIRRKQREPYQSNMDSKLNDTGCDVPESIQARFVSDTGEEAGPPLELPTSLNISQLGRICNAILEKVMKFIYPNHTNEIIFN